MKNQYHYELCWLIREYCRKSKHARKIVDKFREVNSLIFIEDCKNIMALEAVLRIEMLVSEENYARI